MPNELGDLVREEYRVVNGGIVAEKDGNFEPIDAQGCCDRLETYKKFVLDSPALGTLSREIEVPDRHALRTIVEEMYKCINSGVSPAQLGFWISELESVEPRG